MGLSFKQLIEREIEGTEAALNAHREGVIVNEIVLKAMKEELKKQKI